MTLSAYNARIERLISGEAILQNQWVIAETSDLRLNRSGHCYTELIEKDANGETIAKVGAAIWASNYSRLYYKFKEATGQVLSTGMKVLVNVTATFHRLFGIKVIINDINPEYTLGDMARQRQEILNRLTADGIIDMNQQLPWPAVPQRIAVVSAAGAAGYGDFMNQLRGNPYGLQFYTCLFSAVMQGVQTVPTVLRALDSINRHLDLFDCVVIIRGGGATSDLNSFDNYELASTVAQFPLPVIVGIGHERDVTVLDYVASRRVKIAGCPCRRRARHREPSQGALGLLHHHDSCHSPPHHRHQPHPPGQSDHKHPLCCQQRDCHPADTPRSRRGAHGRFCGTGPAT